MSNTITNINLNKLHLDKQNPRLPEGLRKKESLSETDIISWMLQDASIIELMLAIGQNGFFIGEALLVIEENEEYIVIEGNRRLTSLKLLQEPSLAQIHTRKIQKVLDETKKRPNEIPCIVFEKREDIQQYLGYRHVTGIKSWGLAEKARYLHTLLPTLESQDINQQSRELAKKIGSRSDYVKRLLVGYDIYEAIKDSGFYNIPKLNETTFHFNYIADSLRHENIENYMGVNLNSDTPLEKLQKDPTNLHNLMELFFRKNDQNRSRVLGHSKDLTNLNKVLSNSEVTEKLLNGLSLQDATNLVEIDSDTFHHELMESLRSLKTAHSYIHQIEIHNDSDVDILNEIIDLSEIIEDTINSKIRKMKRQNRKINKE